MYICKCKYTSKDLCFKFVDIYVLKYKLLEYKKNIDLCAV